MSEQSESLPERGEPRQWLVRWPKTKPALLTADEVADLFRVSSRTVRRWGAAGILERVRLGGRLTRYTPESVAAFLDSQNDASGHRNDLSSEGVVPSTLRELDPHAVLELAAGGDAPGLQEPRHAPATPGKSDPGAMSALLRANIRAGEIRREAIPDASPGIVRGAPSHSLAFLLTALEEAGWALVKASEPRCNQ